MCVYFLKLLQNCITRISKLSRPTYIQSRLFDFEELIRGLLHIFAHGSRINVNLTIHVIRKWVSNSATPHSILFRASLVNTNDCRVQNRAQNLFSPSSAAIKLSHAMASHTSQNSHTNTHFKRMKILHKNLYYLTTRRLLPKFSPTRALEHHK